MWSAKTSPLKRPDAISTRFLIVSGALLLSSACSKKTPEVERKPVAVEHPVASVERKQPVRTRVSEPAPEPPPDPQLVPVEEDFRGDAEQKLTKRSDLRAELQRIEQAVASAEKDVAATPSNPAPALGNQPAGSEPKTAKSGTQPATAK